MLTCLEKGKKTIINLNLSNYDLIKRLDFIKYCAEDWIDCADSNVMIYRLQLVETEYLNRKKFLKESSLTMSFEEKNIWASLMQKVRDMHYKEIIQGIES